MAHNVALVGLLEAFYAAWVQVLNRALAVESLMGNAWCHIGLQRVGRGIGLPLEHPLRGRTPVLFAVGAAYSRLVFPFC